MFIDARRNQGRPPSGRQCKSGKVRPVIRHGPPDGGRAHFVTGSINMALLTEGGRISSHSINMALLTEGKHLTEEAVK